MKKENKGQNVVTLRPYVSRLSVATTKLRAAIELNITLGFRE